MYKDELNKKNSTYFLSPDVHIFDRAVRKDDVVNIHFFGTIDGAPFPNGDSNENFTNGFNAIAGSNMLVDNLLDKVIGIMPGKDVTASATFPANYEDEFLAGKKAVFVLTVNHIIDIDAVKAAIRKDFGGVIVGDYLKEFIEAYTAVEIPERYMELLKTIALKKYAEKANNEGLSLQAYLALLGASSNEELLEIERSEMERYARSQLIMQAIAEDLGLIVTKDDVVELFDLLGYGEEEIEGFIASQGLPALKQELMHRKIRDLIVENAVFA